MLHSQGCRFVGVLFLIIVLSSGGATNDEAVYSTIEESVSTVLTSIASKKEESITNAPGVVSVISRDEMNRFGARTLKDVLMRMPSTNLTTTYMTDMSCVSIRGDQINAAASHILLLINGRPVREAEEGGIKGEVYESFPVASIDKIEVIRGPGSVLYGSTAFSGVINVITKKPEENKTVVAAHGGVPGRFKTMVNVGYRIGDIGLMVGGQFKNSTPWDVRFQAGDTVFRDFSIPDNGFGMYGEVRFKDLKYMTSYNRWHNYFAFQKYIPPPPVGPIAGRHAYGDVQWDKWFNDLGYTHKFSDIWYISINATFTQSWLEIDSFPAPHRKTFDLTGEWTNFIHPIENMNIIIGVLGNRVQGQERSGLPLSTTLDTAQNTFSGYIQGDYRVSRFKFITGLQANKAEGIDVDINPRAGIICSPSEIVNVKVLYSTAFRAPSMLELYLAHPTLKGNPDLKPEKMSTFDFGVNIRTKRASFGFNNFYSRSTNIIYPKQIQPPPNIYQNHNIATTFIGMEVEGKFYLTRELMFTGSGLYQKNTTGDSAGNMMPVPENSAKGGVSYSADGFTASVFTIYEGKLHKRFDALYNKTRKTFNLLNANMKYEINRLFHSEVPVITFDIEGYNLLNHEVWLPPTGLSKRFTVPVIRGSTFYFGCTVGF